LAFRGFVKVCDIHEDIDGNMYARYQLNTAGFAWVERMSEIEAFSLRWEATQEVAQKVDRLGWSRIVDLVYSEPTFVSARSKGYGHPLPLNDGLRNSAAFLMNTIDRVLKHGFENVLISRELAVEMFFRYLNEYDHIRQK